MQNSNTIKDLGFQPTPNKREFIYRGKYQRFIAIPFDNDCHPYVTLYLVSKKKDTRENSPRKGHYLRVLIKDCTSASSLKEALKKYDLPDSHLDENSLTLRINKAQL